MEQHAIEDDLRGSWGGVAGHARVGVLDALQSQTHYSHGTFPEGDSLREPNRLDRAQ
jgi:hypothetical protein